MADEPLMRRTRHNPGDAGFTLIEVVISMVVILVGVLGTVSLLQRASETTSLAKTRGTQNNLLRDLIDAAQGLPYSSATQATIVSALQTRGFPDDVPSSTATWEIKRQDVTYTVTASVCIVDDSSDGGVAHPSGAGFCADASAGSGDTNGDDYRRVTLNVAPPAGFGVAQTATTIVGSARTSNPGGSGDGGGGGGASIGITSMKIDTSTGKTTLYNGQVARCMNLLNCGFGNGPTTTNVAPKVVYFQATTAATAQKMKFSVDGKVLAMVNGPGTTFNWTWTLPDAQPDGTYTVSAQAYDSSGSTAVSEPKPVTVILNRYLPDPAAFAPASAGRNHLYLQGSSTTSGTPEVETYPSNTAGARLDRDIVGFQVVRFVGSSFGVLGCQTTSILIRGCQDTGAPLLPTSGKVDTLRYRITPYAVNPDGSQQLGNGSPPFSADVNLPNTRPCPPRNVTATRSGTVVTLSWTAPGGVTGCTPTSGDPDTGDCVDFFRVSSKAAGSTSFAYADRVDRTPFGNPVSPCGASAAEASTSITLWEADSSPKSYNVTAVDRKLSESVRVTPTNCATSC